MTCIKTGAVVFVEPENCFYRCDVFEVSDIHYLRITNYSRDRGVSEVAPWASIKDYANWFDRDAQFSTMIIDTLDFEEYPHG